MLSVVLLTLLSVTLPEQSHTVQVSGVVKDADGGVLPAATVELRPVSAPSMVTLASTDAAGRFVMAAERHGVYDLHISLSGFDRAELRISLGAADEPPLAIMLTMARLDERVVVRAVSDSAQAGLAARTEVDLQTLETLPANSASSGLNAVVTLMAPAVAADSNGVFHPLGEHAETSFIIDGQPVSDQQSRIFSNQVSPQVVQTLELTTGVPPAEFGDKTSLIAVVTTRSGIDNPRSTGSVTASYGSFDTPSLSVSLGRGNGRLGNFVAADATRSRRFLDTPEVEPVHADGQMVNVFDRVDVQVSRQTRAQLNAIAAWSRFLTPNTHDQQAFAQDQRQRQHTLNLSASMQHVAGSRTLVDAGVWWRRDDVRYDSSSDPFADRPATLGQHRELRNAGARASMTLTSGRHTLKAGLHTSTTSLGERFHTGITDATFNAPCLDASGTTPSPITVDDPGECTNVGHPRNPNYLPALRMFDLSRGGSLFTFDGRARVQQWAAYAQDVMTRGPWTLSAGLRLDVYQGLSSDRSVQPRAALTRRIDRTGTVLRLAYGRVLLTPYNENLVLASSTGDGGFGGGVPGAVGGAPLLPARRNQYHVGLLQPLGHGVIVDGDYFWKRTDGPFDFNVILNTSLTVPVQFRLSKIDGGFLRVTLPRTHGVQASTTLSHTRSRLFGPSTGGLRFSANYAPVARPDHDQALQQTTLVEYRTARFGGLWGGITWRYDSGLVAVAVRSMTDALALTGDDQAAVGLFCGAVSATISQPIRSCDGQMGATRLRIPAAGTEDDDVNPPRLAPRHLFDVGAGIDTVRVAGLPMRFRVTVVNAFNTVALYNFLSTFSGTHFVTPRSMTAEVSVRF